MLTQMLRWLLVAAIFSGIMAAQTVQIRPSSPQIAATGVKLAALDAPEHADTVKAILGDDANLLAPILPNSVLVVNGSGKKLRAVGVFFRWTSPASPKGTTLVMTALDKDDPAQLKSGDAQIYTPIQAVNHFVGIPAAKRHPPASIAPRSGVASTATLDFANLFQQELARLPGLAGVQATIDSLVFEDYSFVGPDDILIRLQRSHPEVHR